MSKAQVRNAGKYQWNAVVAAVRNDVRERLRITVFCDNRYEAVDEAVNVAKEYGYDQCTVDHIVRI